MAHDQRVIPVRASDGHDFELIDTGPPGAPALLFLPGMGISARNLIPLGHALAGQGLRLLIHEWRGNGSSSLRAQRGVDWGYDELLDFDLVASVDAARKTSDSAPLWLGGHSLGSQLACLAAAHEPDPIDGLVLIAGGAPYWRCYPMVNGLGLYGMLHLLPAIARLLGYYPGKRLGFAGTEARQLMIDWARTGRTGRYAWGQPERDEESALAELRTRVRVVTMSDDGFVPKASTNWLLAKLPDCRTDRREVTARDQGGGKADHFAWMSSPAATATAVAAAMNPDQPP